MKRLMRRPVVAMTATMFAILAAGVAVRATIAQVDAKVDPGSVEQLLKDFATAVQKGDQAAAMKCFATDEDLKGLFADEVVGPSSANMQSRAKLAIPEFIASLKEFGKCDLFELSPGLPTIIPKEQRKNLVELQVFENASVSFAKDANYLIEFRLRIGGIIKSAKNRWVITNMTTRQEFFGRRG